MIDRMPVFRVDKTSFIREWWGNRDEVTLVASPRRFGKTLNLQMFESFFSNRYEGRSDLCEGLSNWNDEKYRSLQGSFPVIFISFADVKLTNYEDARALIISIIRNLFQGFLDEWKTDSEEEKKRYDFMDMPDEVSDAEAVQSLQKLSAYIAYR